MNFGLKNDMIQQVQNSCQFHGLSGDDANKHLNKFLHVTQSIKVNGVTDDALPLYLFPHSLTHHATTWFDRLPRNSITTFEQMLDHLLRLRHLKTHNDCYHILVVREYSYSEAPQESWYFVRSVTVIAAAIVVIVAAVDVESLVRLAKVWYYRSLSLKKRFFREQYDEQYFFKE
nr:reverse transcriptase domain-containing protein [Tanacetum cinerariifolium]GEX19407.1 reverse transcriptase domain-containing protein [Tanacetum cinerariifolium]